MARLSTKGVGKVMMAGMMMKMTMEVMVMMLVVVVVVLEALGAVMAADMEVLLRPLATALLPVLLQEPALPPWDRIVRPVVRV